MLTSKYLLLCVKSFIVPQWHNVKINKSYFVLFYFYLVFKKYNNHLRYTKLQDWFLSGSKNIIPDVDASCFKLNIYIYILNRCTFILIYAFTFVISFKAGLFWWKISNKMVNKCISCEILTYSIYVSRTHIIVINIHCLKEH